MKLLRALRDRIILLCLVGILCTVAWIVGDLQDYRPAYSDFPCLYTQMLVLGSSVVMLGVCVAWGLVDKK